MVRLALVLVIAAVALAGLGIARYQANVAEQVAAAALLQAEKANQLSQQNPYREVDLPHDVFTLYGEAMAIKVNEDKSNQQQSVKIPVAELRKKSPIEFKDVLLVSYDSIQPYRVEHRLSDGFVQADLYSGQTYILFAAPQGDLARLYSLLCNLRGVLGPVPVAPICQEILCIGDSFTPSELVEAFPELRRFGEQLHLDDQPIQIPSFGEGDICQQCTELPGARIIPSEDCIPLPPLERGERPSIAFVSDRDGNSEIYVMNADGTNQQNITYNSAYDTWPRWSPDGKRIAFSSNRNGNSDIFVTTPSGGGLWQVTNHEATDNKPVWGSSGRLYFQSRRDGNWELYYVVADESGNGYSEPAQLTDGNSGAFLHVPDSPGGKELVLSRWDSGTVNNGFTELYILDLHDLSQQPLGSTSDQYETDADWSTTDVVAYTGSTEEFGWTIRSISSDGSNPQILAGEGFNASPVWSPDGSQLAFKSNLPGNWELYLVKADGSEPVNLTNDPASEAGVEYYQSWSPDGKELVFQSDRNGNIDVYKVNVETLETSRLTDASATDGFPQWRPAKPSAESE